MRAREARNRRIANKLVAAAFFRKSHYQTLGCHGSSNTRSNRVTKGGDGDGGGERDVVVGIDSDSELPGIKYAFPRPTRSSWRPPIQLTKGDDPHSDHNTESGFAT